MALLKFRLKGSTLIESILATIIISIVFTALILVFNWNTTLGSNPRQLRAKLICQNVLCETMRNQFYKDEIMNDEDFIIEKKFNTYKNSKNLLLLHINILDNNNILIESYKEVIIIK